MLSEEKKQMKLINVNVITRHNAVVKAKASAVSVKAKVSAVIA